MKRPVFHRLLFGTVALAAVWSAVFLAVSLVVAGGDARRDEAIACGDLLVSPSDAGVPVSESTRVVLITDEEWRATVSAPHPSTARRVVLDAAGLFRGVGIHLLVVRTVDWTSPSDAATIRDVVDAAESSVPLGDADMAIVLTAQERSNKEDGFAEGGGRYAAVAHHPDSTDLDALVLAHEISHLFGANHQCDVPGRSGLMSAQGHDYDLICPCTRRILDSNARRFHEEQG